MIGLGLTTYNRPDYLKQSLQSVIDNNFGGAYNVYIVDDCSDEIYKDEYDAIFEEAKKKGIIVLRNRSNKGVAHSKNRLLQRMIDDGCEHLFLMEDDILMTNNNTCHKYMAYATQHNIHHLNFALHGTMNKGRRSYYKGITVYPECVGAFSYYTKEVIDKVGFMDEAFKNAWEHVEHTYRIAKEGMTTPFWYFADYPLSANCLTEIEGSLEQSSIRPRSDWKDNIINGQKYWIKKHGTWLPEKPSWV